MFQPAVLHEYSRRRVRNADYPGMIEEAGHTVRGAVVTGLTKDNLEKLDYFEGSSYDRRVVRPKLLTQVGDDKGEGNVEGEQVITESYVFLDRESLEDKEWDFQEFRRDKLRKWTRAGYVFEGKSYVLPVVVCIRLTKGTSGQTATLTTWRRFLRASDGLATMRLELHLPKRPSGI